MPADIVIYAVVAIGLIAWLRSILGTRTGLEKPRDPFVPPEAQGDNVVSLRGGIIPGARNEAEIFPGCRRVQAADPRFNPDEFLVGARAAFELIVSAFAAGDTNTLRPLLSDEVFKPFAESIRARVEAKETLETRLISIKEQIVLNGDVKGRTAFVTVKFISDQINATRAADGRVVEGHAELVSEKTDSWTFSRDTGSVDPNWILVATRSD